MPQNEVHAPSLPRALPSCYSQNINKNDFLIFLICKNFEIQYIFTMECKGFDVVRKVAFLMQIESSMSMHARAQRQCFVAFGHAM